MKEMIVMRGLPGSGKTTIVKEVINNNRNKTFKICSADDFFMENGVYKFSAHKIGQAHAACQTKAVKALHGGIELVVIDNTATQKWEYRFYKSMAELFGYKFTIMDLYDGGLTDLELSIRNKHGVPVEAITRMRNRYER